MLVALVDLNGTRHLVHKLRAKQVEVLSEGLFGVHIQDLVLLDDEQVLRELHLPEYFFAGFRQVVKRNYQLRVFVHC